MTLRMLDSINVGNLPDGADAYLGYTGGLDPAGIAFAAGLFDGEGTVGLYAGRHHPRMKIEMTDLEPLELFQRMLGGVGILYREPRFRSVGRKPLYRWQLDGWTGIEIIYPLLKPWLSPRRQAQFEATLADAPPMDRRGQWGWSRQPAVPAEKCRNGHRYTAENLYVSPAGKRTCRTCRNASIRAYRARRRAA